MPCARVRFGRTRLSQSLEAEGEWCAAHNEVLKAHWYRAKAANLKGTAKDRLIGFDGTGFMCGVAETEICASCGFVADYLCDAPIGEGKTCDIAMCDTCRTNIGPELDLCRLHVRLVELQRGRLEN